MRLETSSELPPWKPYFLGKMKKKQHLVCQLINSASVRVKNIKKTGFSKLINKNLKIYRNELYNVFIQMCTNGKEPNTS